MQPSFDLGIPPSGNTIDVKVINSFDLLNGSVIGPPASIFVAPDLNPGSRFRGNIYAFLLEHLAKDGTTERVMFDLGIRKDVENFAPSQRGLFQGVIPSDVPSQLEQGGVSLASIRSVIWSHTHTDHIGDMSLFPSTTSLFIGEDTDTRTYPTYEDASLVESDFAGRAVNKVAFKNSTLSIGGLPAVDFFEDGSFYLLNVPGHCLGHMAGLARVTPTSFILLAGDAFHNGGQIRPSPCLASHFPIPPPIVASSQVPKTGISREIFFAPDDPTDLSSRITPFLGIAEKGAYADPVMAKVKQLQLGVFDSHPDVLVISAHDPSYTGMFNLFPESIKNWKEEGWKREGVWQFANPEHPAFLLRNNRKN